MTNIPQDEHRYAVSRRGLLGWGLTAGIFGMAGPDLLAVGARAAHLDRPIDLPPHVCFDALVGKTEADAAALLDGCLWRVLERDGKSLPGTMDYRQERRDLGIRDGKVIWVRRG